MTVRDDVSLLQPAAEPRGSRTPTPIDRRQRRRVPTHFFVGTLLLYAVVLGTFLLTATSLHRAIPNWRTIVPVAAGVSFYVASNLFSPDPRTRAGLALDRAQMHGGDAHPQRHAQPGPARNCSTTASIPTLTRSVARSIPSEPRSKACVPTKVSVRRARASPG